jgi:FMN reductase
MAKVVTILGSPSEASRTAFVTNYFADQIRSGGHSVSAVVVRDLPAEELLHGRFGHAAIAAAIAAIEGADGVVVATPIYKASFTGVLKVFLDVLPQEALRGKAVQPIGSAGSLAHVLAIDYGLRAVLVALGAEHVHPAYVDVVEASRRFDLAVDAKTKLAEAARRFVRCLPAP